MPDPIAGHHAELAPADLAICACLRREIDAALPVAESKVWHGHPVWFLSGNPIVGYAKRKSGVSLLFWSGQDFDAAGLKPEGKFEAAEARFPTEADIGLVQLRRWLGQSRQVQWDYKNIVKRKGALERLELTETVA
ncbi:DUF1801 domain-containing protein [Novosphingobium sp. B 225]|uniref:DUF1801 domain-containing protein n=1 Tax=Novosphingobium sp. B 225 TaxID=1961849 RepID=UPI000B4A8E9A|nr:DUF1801 domain-containing protein [Novosphingobium sp. B 225]